MRKGTAFAQKSKVQDDIYLEQADDILAETLDKDLSTYQSKLSKKKQQEKNEEAEQELVFDEAIDSIPKNKRAPLNLAEVSREEENQQLIDLFSDPSNLV